MSLTLRPYQIEALEKIWAEIMANDTALCVLPTGSGKTEIMIGMLQKAMAVQPGFRSVVLMGRIDLVTQTERRFARAMGQKHVGVWCGSLSRRETERALTVASVQSADAKRFRKINLIVVDEVHRLDQNQGAYARFIAKAQAENPKLKVVGFTATPFRANGPIYGPKMLFKRVCCRKSIQDMIAMGFLVEPKLKGSRHAFDVSQLRVRAGEYMQEDVDALVKDEDLCLAQVKDALARLDGRTSVAWATANIEHCSRVTDLLMSLGERSTSVHSKQDRPTRDANLAAFMGGSSRHMVFVSVLSEGFDHPPIDAVVMMRPTRSPVLYVQTAGRGIRISPATGKVDCLFLDYGQVVMNLGPLDDPKVKGAKGEGDAVMKECPSCLTYCPGGCRLCPDCGHAFPPPAEAVEKLTKGSDENAKILSEKARPETMECGPAVVSMHEAKSGNQCVRITYEDRNLLTRWGYGGVSEFYVTTSPWAMERLERRLGDIGGSIPSIPFEGSIPVPGTFELVKAKDGKYDRVLSVKKISDATPLGKNELDEPSFNFGANERPDPKPNSPEDLMGWAGILNND